MSTEFNDSQHYGFFFSGDTLRSGNGYRLRQSSLTLAALRSAGVLDKMQDGTAPPATDKLWLDKNTDPATLKEWDATGSAWVPVTFDRLFGRAIVTAMAAPIGSANAIVVAAPSPFIPNRMYSLTPIADNTGAATIEVTGVGTYSVKYADGSDLSPQEFKQGRTTILLFTGEHFEVVFALADIYAIADSFPAVAANTMIVDNADGTARQTKTFPEVRELLDAPIRVANRTVLKALDTTKDTTALLEEAGREGVFQWLTGDYSAQIAADALEGVYIKANAIAATAGAWRRVYSGAVRASWFGGDGAAVQAVASASYENGGTGRGTFTASTFALSANGAVIGEGHRVSTLKRTSSSNAVTGANATGTVLKDVTVDVNRAGLGDVAGHGVRIDLGDEMRFDGLNIKDFGSKTDLTGGGTGLLVVSSGGTRPKKNRFTNSNIAADPASGITVGWLFDDTDWSYAQNIYVQDTTKDIGFAHELKTTSSYNYLSGLMAKNTNVALAYGGEQVGTDGCSYNLASGIIASAANIGFIQSKGKNNLVNGLLHDGTATPGVSRSETISLGLTYLSGANSSASENAVFAALNAGTVTKSVAMGGSKNFVQIAAHAVGTLVDFVSGCAKGVVEIVHPGSRTSIFADVADNSGNSSRGSNANVVISPATGERRGSLSGTYHDKLEESGAAWNVAHYWRTEALNNVIHAMGHNGTSGNLAGWQVSVPGDANRAGWWHLLGATVDDDRYGVRGWGQGEAFNFTKAAFLPTRDATDAQSRGKALGSSTQRFTWGYMMNVSLFPGASVTPTVNGEMSFQLTSNTSLAVKVKGSDGVVRSASLTLA
ncbi:hypothetical protein GOA81_17975 [Sinorhizobium meliloti]|nr:hypothetical protein [Sinorhizobium meliloti]MDW9798881.1 hypothetical protein [Sinorhizobium meliloti]